MRTETNFPDLGANDFASFRRSVDAAAKVSPSALGSQCLSIS